MSRFKPIVHEVTIEDGGETEKFYVREASAKEVLLALGKANGTKHQPQPMENQHENLKFLVADLHGTPLPEDERTALVDMRFRALRKLNEAIADKSGLRTEDTTKNA